MVRFKFFKHFLQNFFSQVHDLNITIASSQFELLGLEKMLSAEERLKFDKIKEKWSGYESKLPTYVTTHYQMFAFT